MPFIWTGTVMTPHPRFKTICDRQFAIDETYTLVPNEEASTASRRHYFASLRDAWMNLPEDLSKHFPTQDHLRRWCLIKAGFCDERSIVCDTPSDARRLAIMARSLDGYAVITHHDETISGGADSEPARVVVIYTAKSQSASAMSKEEFQTSKTAVLDIVSEMIGVNRGTLQKEAGRSA